MRSFSYGERLTQRSFSGTVREARKYLIRRCASLLSALSRVPLWRDERSEAERSSSPLSKMAKSRPQIKILLLSIFRNMVQVCHTNSNFANRGDFFWDDFRQVAEEGSEIFGDTAQWPGQCPFLLTCVTAGGFRGCC